MQPISLKIRFFCLTMAMLMFFTSAGFSMDMHFCQGKLKSISLIGKAKNCHEIAKKMANCPHHQKMQQEKMVAGCSLSKKDCCENKTIYCQADTDQVISTVDFSLNQSLQQFIIAFSLVFISDNLIDTESADFANYKPPLIPRDIPVLLETFLL